MSYPAPSILLDSDITFDLESMDSVPNLAEKTYSFCQNTDVTVSTTFQYLRNKIYAQLQSERKQQEITVLTLMHKTQLTSVHCYHSNIFQYRSS
jgi:hypothetical protein